GAAARPVQQIGGGKGARADARAAVRPHAALRAEMIALSDFDRDVRTVADVKMFGVALDRPGRRVHLVARHRGGVAAHDLPVETLWAPLLPVPGSTTTVTPLPPRIDNQA